MVSAFKAKHKYGNIDVKLPSMPGWLSKLMKVKKKIRVSVQYTYQGVPTFQGPMSISDFLKIYIKNEINFEFENFFFKIGAMWAI